MVGGGGEREDQPTAYAQTVGIGFSIPGEFHASL